LVVLEMHSLGTTPVSSELQGVQVVGVGLTSP
jgi:hypothetical protein